jgi:hypothetical protein
MAGFAPRFGAGCMVVGNELVVYASRLFPDEPDYYP